MNEIVNKNVAIWEAVKKTDPTMTKQVSFGRQYTAIDPTYQAEMATAMFGPYGAGWGLEKSEIDTGLVSDLRMAIHSAVFFYYFEGVRHSFPISNAIEVVSKKGHVDFDFAKKVETNTVSKALSKLGFNSDIFQGRFEDNMYVEIRGAEAELERADNKEEALAEKKKELLAWLEKEVGVYPSISNMQTMGNIYGAHKQKLESLCKIAQEHPAKYVKRLDKAYFEQEKVIKEKESE